MCDNTFSGSDNEDANEHIEKVLEIVDLFHIHNITQDQVMFRDFPMSLTRASSRWLRNEPTRSITTLETLKFYKGLDVPTRQFLNSKGAIPSMKAADAKKAIQEMVDYSQKLHNGTSNRCISTETSDGLAAIQAQLNNLGREIKKDCPLKEKGKTLEETYYTQFGVPFQQGGQYKATALGFYQRNNRNPSYQERRQTMKESLSKFIAESAKRHEENSNLIKEIRATTDSANRNQGASIKALEIQIGKISKVLQERGSGSLHSSTKTNPRDHVKSISATMKLIRPIRPSRYAVSSTQNKEGSCGLKDFDAYSIWTTLLDDALPHKEKDSRSFTLPWLGELAPTKLIVELADRTVKRPKARGDGITIIKRWRQDLHRDGVRDLATTSGRDRLKADIESSTRRQCHGFKATLYSSYGIVKLPVKSSKPPHQVFSAAAWGIVSMGDANPIRTLGDYSKPSHEGYKNTIKLLVGTNVDEGWNDPVVLEKESLNYENPDLEQLLGIMEYKVRTLMDEEITLMGRSESIFGISNNLMHQLPPEPSRQEAFEDLVMNFILDQEERVKQLEEYIDSSNSACSHYRNVSKQTTRTLKVLEKVGSVAYKLELPQELSRVHNTFHVSNLKKCYSDEPLAVPLEGLHVDDKLRFVEEPVEIMDREVKRLKQSRIPIVKVRWNSRRGPEFTWEREDQFQKKYPHLFTKPVPSSSVAT
ncbi:hypothetical protein Tco_0866089 [Tanacetum coccineum]